MLDVLTHTLIVTVPLLAIPTVVLLASLAWGREAFRQDYPEDIQKRMSVASRAEAVRGWVLGTGFLVSLLAVITVSAVDFLGRGPASLAEAYGITLLGMIAFVVIDLVVVDWLVICAWRPRWVVIPGTEDCAGWGDYAFHARVLAQLKAVAANLVLPLPLALIAWGLS